MLTKFRILADFLNNAHLKNIYFVLVQSKVSYAVGCHGRLPPTKIRCSAKMDTKNIGNKTVFLPTNNNEYSQE